jgi:hypothetical protein
MQKSKLQVIVKEEIKAAFKAKNKKVHENYYAGLGGSSPLSDSSMKTDIVEPNLGPNYEAFIMMKNWNEYGKLDKQYPSLVTQGWKSLYRSDSGQGYARISPDGKVIKAAILTGNGIEGAFYVKSGGGINESVTPISKADLIVKLEPLKKIFPKITDRDIKSLTFVGTKAETTNIYKALGALKIQDYFDPPNDDSEASGAGTWVIDTMDASDKGLIKESKPYFKYVDKELYPNPGMEVNARDIDNEMMIYFIKKNFKLLITTKNEKDIPGSITKQNNNYQFLRTGGSNSSTSDEINKKDILSIKIVRD